MTNEENSAELEAERILKDEFAKARAEACPQGEDCPVHFRIDDEYYIKSSEYARLITYVGEYCVVTEDNPDLQSPALLVRAVLGQVTQETLPPRWSTMVFFVGKEGVIGDAETKTIEERKADFRYHRPHDDWDEIRAVHTMTVTMVEMDMVDLSKPVQLED